MYKIHRVKKTYYRYSTNCMVLWSIMFSLRIYAWLPEPINYKYQIWIFIDVWILIDKLNTKMFFEILYWGNSFWTCRGPRSSQVPEVWNGNECSNIVYVWARCLETRFPGNYLICMNMTETLKHLFSQYTRYTNILQ